MKTHLVCPTCKKDFLSGDKFCSTDGSTLVEMPWTTCRHCDTVLHDGDKFCRGCGYTREAALSIVP